MTEEKTSPSKSDFKAVKIDNGAWLPEIAEHIAAFCKKAHVDGIQPGNLQTYFAKVAQGWYGKDATEFWLVFEDGKPVAFASWLIMDLPHIAKVSCSSIYSWTKNKQAIDLLVDEYIKFGEQCNAVWWSLYFINKAVRRLFEIKMKERGFESTESGMVNVICRKLQQKE